ncbi:MAG: Sensor protein [Candidatus Saccharicenans subterraneus]|uniref:histidine kinase n=1 Tax=Candidatus Saccharicenans subterraneus TaxID=2508984 RepID=A0A3E2BNX8_9BACT|nr:MAG: Sensor protein [Candidatus Saccharicenans subterraneum]
MIRIPRPRISIYVQLVFWTSVIILLLMFGVLYVIQTREVKAIYQEKRERGLVMVRYISEMNVRSLVLGDLESIDENISGLIREDLAYVIFYDADSKPVVVSESIADNAEVINQTSCAGEVSPGDVFYNTIRLNRGRSFQEVMEVEVPVFVPGSEKKWGSVKIGLKLEDVFRRVQRTRLVLLGFGLAAFLLTVLGANLLARRITRPIKNLVEGTRRISRGDFSYRIPVISRDEIGDLTRSFNQMAEELLRAREQMEEANRRLLQAEKLASIGRLSATIAHEIRNPLTSVKLNIQKLAEISTLDELEREHLAIAQAGIEQIEKFIKDLLSYTRASSLQKDYFSLAEVLDESLKLLQPSLKEKEIVVEKDYQPDLPPAYVDADRLRQVFLNVLRNAYEAVDQGGRIEISLRMNRAEDGSCFEVRISDNGCGIQEKDRENIFEPFFTTKSSGAGLGLANARRILDQHGGTIRVVDKEGRGSCFLIILPCPESKQEAQT